MRTISHNFFILLNVMIKGKMCHNLRFSTHYSLNGAGDMLIPFLSHICALRIVKLQIYCLKQITVATQFGL